MHDIEPHDHFRGQDGSGSTFSPTLRPRLGISRCLLGDAVRYDGGHKRDPFLAEVLGRFVEWIPVCPEVEAGLGAPREPMRLTEAPESPRLLTVQTHRDQTPGLTAFCESRIRELRTLSLDGFVFKHRSPSCGTRDVPLYRDRDRLPVRRRNNMGLFARAFHAVFPYVPIEDEVRLRHHLIRHNFLVRIFCLRRWRQLFHDHATVEALKWFHERHRSLLLTHSRRHTHLLDRLVRNAATWSSALAHRYGSTFMEALTITATVRKHTRRLTQLARAIEPFRTRAENDELARAIAGFEEGSLPLAHPVSLIARHVRIVGIAHLADQVYLFPYPRELMCRHVSDRPPFTIPSPLSLRGHQRETRSRKRAGLGFTGTNTVQ